MRTASRNRYVGDSPASARITHSRLNHSAYLMRDGDTFTTARSLIRRFICADENEALLCVMLFLRRHGTGVMTRYHRSDIARVVSTRQMR